MSHLSELTAKLREIFQIDRPDLDFGIYRILNSRAERIADYLHNTLPKKVQAAFSDGVQSRLLELQRELEAAQKAAEIAGFDAANSPKVRELNAQIAQAKNGGASDEAAVYNHLLTFFSRYYEEGDFISQRRYKGNTYAIPYNGEEVLLHWANKDQYYTKSGENFSNYRFALSDGKQVCFRLVRADTAKDNQKDSKRVFVLWDGRSIERIDEDGEAYTETVETVFSDGNTLEIRFEYIISKDKQDETKEQDSSKDTSVNGNTVRRLKEILGEKREWQALFADAPTEKKPQAHAVAQTFERLHPKKHRRLFHPQRLGRLFAARTGFLHQKRSDESGQRPIRRQRIGARFTANPHHPQHRARCD